MLKSSGYRGPMHLTPSPSGVGVCGGDDIRTTPPFFFPQPPCLSSLFNMKRLVIMKKRAGPLNARR